jgi:hypothetical protein
MEVSNNGPDFAHFFEMENIKKEMQKEINDLKKAIKNKEQTEKEEKYSHFVQMLILDYLGVGKNLKTNIDRAKIYAPLIRRDLKTTIQYFSDLHANKNEKNLTLIIDFFNKAGFPDLAQKAQDDLNILNKRKY